MNNIEIYFEDVEEIDIFEKVLHLHLNSLIKKELKKTGDISIVFCSDAYLLEMNKQYLQHDYYTDIITFDYVEDDVVSGDLFISMDRIKDNAKNFDSEFMHELYRVAFHGVLHLVGYKDKTEEEQKQMRAKENHYLSEVDFSEM